MAQSLYLCLSILGKRENDVPGAPALSFPISEDECYPHCSLGPGPQLSLEAFSSIICWEETEAASLPVSSPPPTPGASAGLSHAAI